MTQVNTQWHDSNEGPFTTRDEAERFAQAECGVEWRVVEQADGYHIEVREQN